MLTLPTADVSREFAKRRLIISSSLNFPISSSGPTQDSMWWIKRVAHMLYTPDRQAVLTLCGNCSCLVRILMWAESHPGAARRRDSDAGHGRAFLHRGPCASPGFLPAVVDTAGALTPTNSLGSALPDSALGHPAELEFRVKNE